MTKSQGKYRQHSDMDIFTLGFSSCICLFILFSYLLSFSSGKNLRKFQEKNIPYFLITISQCKPNRKKLKTFLFF